MKLCDYDITTIVIIIMILLISPVPQRWLTSDSLPLLLEVLHGATKVRGLPVKGDDGDDGDHDENHDDVDDDHDHPRCTAASSAVTMIGKSTRCSANSYK